MPGLTLVKKTKILIPRRRPEFLQRTRLIDTIHAHTDKRLFLVSAPAGYGKTTLLVDFANDTDLPVCWYSLDSAAQEPRLFIEHFVASIRQRFPAFGEQTLETLDNITDFSVDGLTPVLVSLVNEILDDIPDYFVIILDDFHLIEQSTQVTTFLGRFLEDAPENCCVIVAGRTVPSRLPIVALASKQQVAGLGSSDLRFTPEETAALIKQMYDLDLSPQEIRTLAHDSEGWITGILLSAHMLSRGTLKGLIHARGTMTVYDYLASEVFIQQDVEVQDFLLGTSILEELNPELCDAVLGTQNARTLLSLLEDRNLFLSRLEGEGQWYRYHRLFQGYLASRLERDSPARFAELHRRAAEYWKGTGDAHQAIFHFLRAGEHAQAAELMEAVSAETFVSGQHLLLIQWHEALPPRVAEQHPGLLLYVAKAFAEQGQPDSSLALLDRTRALFASLEDSSGIAQTAVQKATVLRMAGHYAQSAELCREASSLIPEIDAATTAEIYRCWGISVGHLGMLAEAQEKLEKSWHLYHDIGREFNAAQVRVGLGSYLERMGRLDEALSHFEKAVETFRQYRNPGELTNALNSVAVIYYYRGEYDRARETFDQALQTAQQAGHGWWTGYVLAGLGDIDRDTGQLPEALNYYQKSLSLLDEKQEGFLAVYIRAAQAEVHAAQGEPLRGYDLARQALELARSHRSSYEEGLANTALGLTQIAERPASAIEALQTAAEQLKRNGATRDLARASFLLAAALHRNGDRQQSLARLEKALALAESLRYRHALRPLSRWASSLLAEAEGKGFHVADLLVEPVPVTTAPPEVAEAPPRVPPIRLQGLGVSRVEMDGETCLGGWNKARELLFLLVTHNHGDGVRKEEAFASLWPNASEAKAHSNFHSLLYRFRRVLPEDSVLYDDSVYRFAPPGGFTYDVDEFRALIEKAAAAESGDASIRYYEEAIGLYNGDFLEDLYSDWSEPYRRMLRDQFLVAISKVAHHHWQNEQVEMAITVAHRWLQAEPYDEAAHRLLMRCHAAQGNTSAVKRQFRQCQDLLRKELDADPEEETLDLYQSLVSEL